MNQKNEIVGKIKEAMEQACSNMYSFTDKPELTFNAEYLFTVMAALAINNANFIPAVEYEIRLEHSTRKFARDCLPVFKKGNSLVKGSSVLRKKGSPKINRPGRVDIAIYSERPGVASFGRAPLCAIEIKGFNPQRILVIDDLKRNLEFMRINGETGKSLLNFTAFAALHNCSQTPSDMDGVLVQEKAIKDRYKAWMAALGSRDDVLEEIETFTIGWNADGTISEENGEALIDTSTRHHFVGAIVTFTQLEASKR